MERCSSFGANCRVDTFRNIMMSKRKIAVDPESPINHLWASHLASNSNQIIFYILPYRFIYNAHCPSYQHWRTQIATSNMKTSTIVISGIKSGVKLSLSSQTAITLADEKGKNNKGCPDWQPLSNTNFYMLK